MNTQTLKTLENPLPARPAGRLSYSVEEVISLTGLGRTTLYRLMAQGELISCKIGRRRLIRASDLNVFLDRIADSTTSE